MGASGAAITESSRSLPLFSSFILRVLSDPKPQGLSKRVAELGTQGVFQTQNSRVSMEDAGRSSYGLHRVTLSGR